MTSTADFGAKPPVTYDLGINRLEVYAHVMPLSDAPVEPLELALVRTRCGPESR